MPLIDLTTKLKTLKFSMDMPGGGSSGLPYIQFPLPKSEETFSNWDSKYDFAVKSTSEATDKFKNYYSTNRSNLDFPIRGGSISSDLQTPVSVTLDLDRERIAKFMKDGARGAIFLKKQLGLQLSNPKIQTADSIPTFKISELPGMIENTRIYNYGRNTLTQVQVQGTGIHVNRAGLLPFNPIEKFYRDIVGAEKTMWDTNQNESELIDTNRLLIFQKLKLKSRLSNPEVNLQEVANIDRVNKLGISLNRQELFTYMGGPGSVYGIGSTTIRRYVDTTEAINNSNSPMTGFAMTYDTLMDQSTTRPGWRKNAGQNARITDFQDFRDRIDGPYKGLKQTGSNWDLDNSQRRDVRFFDGWVDKINKLPQFKYNPSEEPWKVTEGKTAKGNIIENINEKSQDIVKFVFECIDNDDPNESVALFFRAHLGSISDNNTAQWNAFKYMGRGENFYTYGGFDRSLSFSFKIGIGSRDELDITYAKLNYLVSQVYPDYQLNSGFMRGPLMKLTMGDYLYRMPGFAESVNISIPESSTWETENGRQLPHFLDVSITYRPILNKLPQRGRHGVNSAKFFAEPIWKKDKVIPGQLETPT